MTSDISSRCSAAELALDLSELDSRSKHLQHKSLPRYILRYTTYETQLPQSTVSERMSRLPRATDAAY